jgi:putative oxidoreductase
MAIMQTWFPRILAILRIVSGLLFIEHATVKFFQFPAAMPGMPHPLPAMLLVAGAIELVGGTLITLGLFTRIAAFVASGEMAVAYWTTHAPQGFWPVVNQGELAILFCFIFLYFAAVGPGAWSLDALLRKSAPQPTIH